MIRKLRKKFVILSTISLLLLLGIIVVSSNFLTYRELVDKADIVLDMIVENGGRPPFSTIMSSTISALSTSSL